MNPSQNMKHQKIPKAIIYTPFLNIDSEEDYISFLRDIFKDNTGNEKINGLELRYDKDARMASWDGYFEHKVELDTFKDTHSKRFKLMFAEKSLDYVIKELNCPINLDSTTNAAKEIFDKYHGKDVIFVHCHGNTDVIGTGGFILTPRMLAQNLHALGLSKTDSPTIVVWSCNSGTKNLNCKSYAENLMTSLQSKKFGFKNICVIGIDAKIEPRERARKSSTLVTYEGKEEYEVLRVYASPSPKKKFIELKGVEDALWTQIKKFQEVRSKRIKIEPRKLDFNNLKSTPKKKLNSQESRNKAAITPTTRIKRSGTQSYHAKSRESSITSSSSISSEENIFSPYKYQPQKANICQQISDIASPKKSSKLMFSSRGQSLIEQRLHQETPRTVSVTAEEMARSSFGQGSNTAKRLLGKNPKI